MADVESRALAERLQGLCLGRRLTVALAESCTGGLIAAAITDVPGASGYFRGGVVAYADDAKVSLLGVAGPTIAAHGAVSAQAARAMALGARERFEASIAASVTGIAGPDGGSPGKPVGLTYIAVADPMGAAVRRYVWPGDRDDVRRESAREALRLLIERAQEQAPDPGAGS